MKRLLIIIISVVQFSCLIKDQKTEIKEILDKGDYTVEWTFRGCFGGATQRIVIADNNTATITWIYPDYPGKPERESLQIPWSINKAKSLKKFFEEGIAVNDWDGMVYDLFKVYIERDPSGR